jgi:hypothetical protein
MRVALFAVLATLGCTSAPSESPPAGEPASDASAPPEIPDARVSEPAPDAEAPKDDAGAMCNTLKQEGAPFPITEGKGDAPTPGGGTITDGTWVAVESKLWGLPPGSTSEGSTAVTWSISGSTIQTVTTDLTTNEVMRQTLTFSTKGTEFTSTETCLAPGKTDDAKQKSAYTATPTTLSVIQVDGNATVMLVLEKK